MKNLKRPKAVPMRQFAIDDRNYDMLNIETINLQNQYNQYVIENSRNGVTESEDSINCLRRLQDTRLLRDAIKHEKKLLEVIGHQHSEKQSKKAQLERPIKNEAGEKLDDVIRKLARNHPNERPRELWAHFQSELAKWSDSECTESRAGKPDSWRYHFKIADKEDCITLGIFRKKLKEK